MTETNFWERLKLFTEAISVSDTVSIQEKEFILSVCNEQIELEKSSDKLFGIAITTFQQNFPNVTSSDLQAFTIGWKSKNNQIKK